MEKVSLTYGPVIPPATPKMSKTAGKPFGDVLSKAIRDVDKMQNQASVAIEKANTGTGGLPEAMIAMEKAGVALQAMLTVRNKVIESYQEIMRIQV
ncbi:MAG: Flagellar hook-basal body complex protein FliE [Syntrophus sp. SKADARSKE-3]|nr:Flagellar hook-basal body complex protein FliE [Syntrophus sp. SKADARSKE-3]